MPHIPSADLNIYYLEKGEGTPVVFVHGNWTTGTEWEPVLDRLPPGWRGLAPDVRGRGQTTGPDNDYTMPELAADLRAFVDALGLDTFHLVGHSLGSAIALQFALESPERLKTLTVLAPGWVDGMPAAYNVPAAQQALHADPAYFAQALKFQMPTLPDGDLWQRLVTEGHQQRVSATLANLPALVAWQPGDALGAIPVPVLVVSGEQDVLTGGASAERAAAVLHTQSVVIPGTGHSPNVEAPDQFMALLLAHLVGEGRAAAESGSPASQDTQQGGGAMAEEEVLSGITTGRVPTRRLTMRVLSSGPAAGEPVVFIHGNVSSAIFWEETMLALPPEYRALAPDLRGYGGTDAEPIDATRGLRDWADDLHALAETLALPPFHLVGWSMGAGVAMQYTMDHPATVRSLTLMSPLAPYGFGSTKDVAGTLTCGDAAGSGGGTVNPDFLQRLKDGDRSGDSPTSPRSTMNAFYFKPPFQAAPEREEAFVTAMLSTRTGDGFYPGDLTMSANWPTVAPGAHGINNAMAPTYCNLSGFATLVGPPVLWVRGADDQIVSDTSFFDFGFLGQLGAVPGWPGAEVYPPQPMVGQMRAVLDAYQANGGHYWEKVIPDCGHSPHIEKPAEFQALLLAHLRAAAND